LIACLTDRAVVGGPTRSVGPTLEAGHSIADSRAVEARGAQHRAVGRPCKGKHARGAHPLSPIHAKIACSARRARGGVRPSHGIGARRALDRSPVSRAIVSRWALNGACGGALHGEQACWA